jgi:BirA family biotin operon repressor/biotin-[acetyl-CoA-carboxylase] ligase
MEMHRPRPPLDAAALRDGLVGAGLPWRRLEVVEETGSTNADLLARAAAGDDIDGAVLLAEHQRSGRGRHNRRWITAPGAQLALSVGVGAEAVPAPGWGWAALATGVAVVDALAESTGVDAGLKWPNDVLAGGGKLAGILAEVAAPKPVIVVGLGLNVTLGPAEVPDLFATSLAMLGAAMVDRNVLAHKILQLLGERLQSWRTAGGADEALIADYRRRSLTLGTPVRASLPGDRVIEGLATAIDELGRLRIETDAGAEMVSAADVTHLRSDI